MKLLTSSTHPGYLQRGERNWPKWRFHSRLPSAEGSLRIERSIKNRIMTLMIRSRFRFREREERGLSSRFWLKPARDPSKIITTGLGKSRYSFLPHREEFLFTGGSAYKGHLCAVDSREWTCKSNLAPFASAPRTLCINHAHRELMEQRTIKIWSCYRESR